MSDGKVHVRSIGFLSLLAICLFLAAGCSNSDKTVEKKLEQAQQKVVSGELDEAIRILNALHEQVPEHLGIIELLAFTHSDNSDPAQAAAAFAKAALLAPDRAEYLLYAAQASEQAGDLAQAADHYRVYLMENFDDPSAWQALARLEEQRDLPQDAVDAYLHVYRIRPSGATAADIGELFFRLQNLAQAHHWFATSREHSGESSPKALLGLLRISMEEENWERARELVQELDRDHPGQLDANELTRTRAELRQWQESVEEMAALRQEQAAREAQREEEKIELAKQEEEERLARARADEAAQAEQARLAELAKAEAGIASDAPPSEEEEPELVESDPSVGLRAEGAALFEARRYGAASEKFWTALSYDDSSAQTWFNLSRAQFHAESWNDAELTALEALRRDPDRQVYHLHYLNVIKQTQPVRAYLRELERVHQTFPANPEVVLALANTYARSQYAHQDAIRYYYLFLRLVPDDARRPEVEQAIGRLDVF